MFTLLFYICIQTDNSLIIHCLAILPYEKIILLLVLLLSIQSQSQTYVKVNANHFVDHSNVGIETSIGKKSTFQLDILGSPWSQ
jgi:hypothetical protein